MNQPITSTSVQLVKNIVQLHAHKGRLAAQQFIGEGLRVCSTLCTGNTRLRMLLCTQEMYEQVSSFAPQRDITIVSEHVMDKISPSKTPSGVLGIFDIAKQKTTEKLNPGLVLACVSDPGNMGTLIRSSIAFGFNDIILVEGVDPWNPKVVQASAGLIGQAHIIALSWPELVAHKQRPPLAALVVRGGTDVAQTNKNVLLVVGNEAHGLSQAWQGDCPIKVTVPMTGNAESLNAAIAGSLALYLIARN